VRRHLAAPGVALLLLPLCGARAQRLDATLDAGVANVAYDEYARSSAFVLAPTVAATGTRGSLEGRAALSLFEGGSRSVQVGGAGRLAFAPTRPLSLELVGDGGATVYNDVDPIVAGRAELLAHYRIGALWQLTAGPTIGLVTNTPSARELVGFTAGLSGVAPGAAYGVRVSPSHVGSLAYADTELWGGWARGRFELGGTAGLRTGDLGAGTRAWVSGGAALWIGPSYGLVAGAGAYPAEIVQGVPGGRFATLAFRVRAPGRGRSPAGASPAATLARAISRSRAPDAPTAAVPPAAAGFSVIAARRGHYRLALRAPLARRVELMGDFTNWEPVPLTRAPGGHWEVVLPLAPGARRFNVRVDGGPWTVPQGVPTVADDFGSVVGVLSIL
jgi:hypothetical protein